MDIKPTGITNIYKPEKTITTESLKHQVDTSTDQYKSPDEDRTEYKKSPDDVFSLGILALGGDQQLRDWEDKGLYIGQGTILAAYEVFNEATRLDMNNPDSNGISFNRFQIVKNNQQVEHWFEIEYQQFLEALTEGMIKNDFVQGRLYSINRAKIVKPHFFQSSLYNQNL